MDASTFRKVIDAFCFPPAKQGVSAETMVAFVQASQNEALRVQDLQLHIESNLLYVDSFIKMDLLSKRISEWNAEVPQYGLEPRILLNRSLGLLGKTATRNAVLSIAMLRSVGVPFPKKGPKQQGTKDSLKLSPREQLNFAITSEDFCQDHNFVSSDTAFLAGLHYDYVAQKVAQMKLPPEIRNAVGEIFKEGQLVARCAYQIAGKLKNVPMGKYVYCSGLLIPIGKALMIFAFPKDNPKSWTNWMAEIKKSNNCEWDYLEYQESERFGITHLELSGLLMKYLKHLSVSEPAVTYCRDAYALKNVNADQYSLSMILSLGRVVAALVQGSKTPLERLFLPFHLEWLEQSKLTKESILELAELVKSGKDLLHNGGP